MKTIGLAFVTLAVTALMLLAGLGAIKLPIIQGPRSAVITLGAFGFFFCTISVGKFISASPAHPLTIAGYLLGSLALLTLLTQIFRWNLPLIHDPRSALYVLTAVIVIKTVIGRFEYALA